LDSLQITKAATNVQTDVENISISGNSSTLWLDGLEVLMIATSSEHQTFATILKTTTEI
jgi:hypothetical protein